MFESLSQELVEKAKWRSNPNAIANKEDPNEFGGSEHDDYYGYEAPRSTGRMTAKGDTGNDPFNSRANSKYNTATKGERTGMATKKHINRLKDKIRPGAHKSRRLPENTIR